ncbi:hypothetical protein BaRGS_00031548 [Batillaria attramentaria]|uniref:Secreted protein n=1 Tax=Batillaria attramentaria TaxID=370345 RepID=A0ABD0JQR8_9CAEN
MVLASVLCLPTTLSMSARLTTVLGNSSPGLVRRLSRGTQGPVCVTPSCYFRHNLVKHGAAENSGPLLWQQSVLKHYIVS